VRPALRPVRPEHICDPLLEPDPPNRHAGSLAPPAPPHHPGAEPAAPPDGPADRHAGHAPAAAEEAVRSPHEVMGHGGHGAMSMAAMVADMRNRFLVAALFAVAVGAGWLYSVFVTMAALEHQIYQRMSALGRFIPPDCQPLVADIEDQFARVTGVADGQIRYLEG
jgi:hypothetical protein